MASVAEQLIAEISVDLSGLEKGIAAARTRLGDLRDTTDKTSSESGQSFANAWERGAARASAALNRFTGVLQQTSERAERLSATTGRIGLELSAGLTAPVAELLKIGIGFDDVKQRAQLAFTNMLGSATQAKSLMVDLQKFDLQTPLDFGDTLKGAQQLKQMGTAAKDLVPSLKAVTDNLSNSSEGITAFPRIIHALGEMQATSRLTGGEMLMLARDGVPAYQYLSEAMGVTTGKLREMETQGLIPGTYAFKALIYEMEKHAPDGAANMLHSLQGAFSNVKNFAEQTIGEMFKPLHDDLVLYLNRAQDSLGKFKEQVTGWSVDTKNKLAGIFLGLGATGPAFLALSGLARVFSLLLTPMGLVSVAVASLTAYLFTHREAVKSLTDYLQSHGNQIMGDFATVMRTAGDVGAALAPVLVSLAPSLIELFHALAQVLGVFNQLPTPLKDAAFYMIAFGRPTLSLIGWGGKLFGVLGDLKAGTLGWSEAIVKLLPNAAKLLGLGAGAAEGAGGAAGATGLAGLLSRGMGGGGLAGYLKSMVAGNPLARPVGGYNFAGSLGGQLAGGAVLALPALTAAWGLSAINSEHNATNDERSRQAGMFDPSPWLDKMSKLRQEMHAAGQGTEAYTALLHKLHQVQADFRHKSGADARAVLAGKNQSTFGGSQGWTVASGRELGARFGITDIGGRASSGHIKESDHYTGSALDFMVGGDKAKGDALAAYAVQHAAEEHIKYLIWQQHIFNPSRAAEGWRLMPNRGSATANHMDHVHVSYTPTPPGASSILSHPPKFTPDNTKAAEQAAKAAASELASLKQQSALYGNATRIADLEYRRKHGDLMQTEIGLYRQIHAAAAALDADDARKEARDKAQQASDEQKRAGQEALNKLLEKGKSLHESIAKLTLIPRGFAPGKLAADSEYEGVKTNFAQTDLSALSPGDKRAAQAKEATLLGLARQADAAKNWHDAMDAATQRNGELKKSLDVSASATQVQKDKYDLAHLSLSALTTAFGKHGAAMAAALTVMLQTNIALDQQVSLHNVLIGLRDRAAMAALPRAQRETAEAAGGLNQWNDWTDGQRVKFSSQLGATQGAEAQRQATDALEAMTRETALVGDAVTQAAQSAAGGADNWNRLTGVYQTNLRKAVELKTATEALYAWKRDGTADQITDLQAHLNGTFDPAKQAGVDWARQNRDSIAQMRDVQGNAATNLEVNFKQWQATQKYNLEQQVAGYQEMQKMGAEAQRKALELSAADPFQAWLVSLYQVDAATGKLRLPPGMDAGALRGIQSAQEQAQSAEKLRSLNDDLVRKAADVGAANPFEKWLLSFETIEHHVDALGRVTTSLALPDGMSRGDLKQVYNRQQSQDMMGQGISGLGNAAWAGMSAALKPDTSSLVQLNQQMDALKIKRTQLQSEAFVNRELPNNPYIGQLKEINRQIDQTQNKLHGMGNSLGSVFHRLFGTMYQDFAQTLQKIAMAYLQSHLMQLLSGSLSRAFGMGGAGASGGSGGGLLSGALGTVVPMFLGGGGAKGAAMPAAGGSNLFAGAFGAAPSFGVTALSAAGIMGHAQGGQVRAGVPFLGNENGPEMFMPNKDGTVIPNDKLGDLGGDNYTTNVHINLPPGTDVPAFRRASSVIMAEARMHAEREFHKNR